jgi:3-hydroxy acid dehydrogenase/malonic semialdehyde reductase
MSKFSPATASRLHGKMIVITGASSGIGLSTAFELARTCPHNLRLILAARRTISLQQVAEDIMREVGNGVKTLPVELDVSKPDQIRNFVDALPEEWRDISVLINNV